VATTGLVWVTETTIPPGAVVACASGTSVPLDVVTVCVVVFKIVPLGSVISVTTTGAIAAGAVATVVVVVVVAAATLLVGSATDESLICAGASAAFSAGVSAAFSAGAAAAVSCLLSSFASSLACCAPGAGVGL